MKATKRGIILTKPEIAALCEFSGRDPDHKRLHAVHFRVAGPELVAFVSDGRRALEVSAVADKDAYEGEWSLDRNYAVELGRLLTGAEHAVVGLGVGALQAVIEDIETGAEQSTLVWPSDGASRQLTLETVRDCIALPVSAKRVACMTLPASQLAAVGLVGKAAGWDVVDVYAPKLRTDPIVFRVTGHGNTWTGAIMPTRGDEETEEDKAERGVKEAVDKFRDTLDEHGATVTLTNPQSGKSVTLKPRSKGRAKNGGAEAT